MSSTAIIEGQDVSKGSKLGQCSHNLQVNHRQSRLACPLASDSTGTLKADVCKQHPCSSATVAPPQVNFGGDSQGRRQSVAFATSVLQQRGSSLSHHHNGSHMSSRLSLFSAGSAAQPVSQELVKAYEESLAEPIETAKSARSVHFQGRSSRHSWTAPQALDKRLEPPIDTYDSPI